MENIRSSNSRLANAAKDRPNTRPRVENANKNAKKVSDSNSSSIGSKKEQFTKTVAPENHVASRAKPSFEGLMKSSAAHVIVNKTGYDNPKHQKARNTQVAKKNVPQKIPNTSSINFTPSLKKHDIINNYSKISFSKNSKASLEKMLKTDKLF